MKKFKIGGIQVGPYSGSYEKNWTLLAQKTEKLFLKESPYLISYSEMMTSPYFAAVQNKEYFSYAETMKGPTVEGISEMAVTLGVHLLGTMFEKSEENGQVNYYNTAFICSPTRGLIGKYRKVHLPKLNTPTLSTDEKFYFEQFGGGGKQFPVFTLDNGVKIGILICFDRSFPEAWKALTIQGAEIIVVPTATYGFRKDLYIRELQIRAMENNIFVMAVNKAGNERIRGEQTPRNHFGSSCIIDPFGQILSNIGKEEWSSLIGQIDLNKRHESKEIIDWNNERKPSVYANYLNGIQVKH